jgi:hypothetical protein
MENKLDVVKRIIKSNRVEANSGIYFTTNTAGDVVTTLYKDKDIDIEICYECGYFEVYGLNKSEQEEIERFYKSMLTIAEAVNKLTHSKELLENTLAGYEAKPAFDMAIKSLEAWEQIIIEIKDVKAQEFKRADRSDFALAECYGYQTSLDIIKKHLGDIW